MLPTERKGGIMKPKRQGKRAAALRLQGAHSQSNTGSHFRWFVPKPAHSLRWAIVERPVGAEHGRCRCSHDTDEEIIFAIKTSGGFECTNAKLASSAPSF